MFTAYPQWKYRTPYRVSNPPTESHHQILITVTWRPGMRRDFSDIRFATDRGVIFPYFVETSTTGSSASVWIRLPQNCAKFYCYYGNGAAVSESNGNAVFEFFDDFLGSSIDFDRWQMTGSNVYTVSGGKLLYSFYSGGGGTFNYFIKSKGVSFGVNYAIVSRQRETYVGGGYGAVSIGFNHYAYPYYVDCIANVCYTSSNTTRCIISTNTESRILGSARASSTTFKRYEVARYSGSAKYYIDGTLYDTLTNANIPSTELPVTIGYGYAGSSTYTYTEIDFIAVRKAAATEPSATEEKYHHPHIPVYIPFQLSEEEVEKSLTGKYTIEIPEVTKTLTGRYTLTLSKSIIGKHTVYKECHAFTSSGTLVVPSWARKATFTIQGGGGGGGGGRGGANVQYWGERGYGGRAGDTLITTTSVTPGEMLTIYVGNGGMGAPGSSANSIGFGQTGQQGGQSYVSKGSSTYRAFGGSGGSGGSNLYKYRDRSHGTNGTSTYTSGISASNGQPGEDAIDPYGQHLALGGEAGLGGSGYGAGGGGGGGGAWAIYDGGDGGNGGAGAKGYVLICFEVPVEKGITGRSKIHLGRTITGVSDILINQEKELTGLSDILLEAELTGKFDVIHPTSSITGTYDIGATRTITGKFDVIFPWTTVTGKSDILLEAELTGKFDVIFPWTTVTGKSDIHLSTSITGVFTTPSKIIKTDTVNVALGESSLVTVLINSTDEVLVALVDMHGRYLQSSDTVLIKGSMEAPPEVGLYGQGDDTILISLGELTRRQFTCTDEALIAVEEGDIRKFFLSTDTVNVALGELTRRQFTKTDTVNAALVETRIIENTAPQADDEVLISLGELTRRQFTCTDEALIAVEEGGPGITARISRADTVLIKVNEITARAFEREDAVLIALGERTRRKFDGVDAVLLAVDETGEVPTVRILSSETVLIALGEEITFPLKQTRVSRLRTTTRRRADLDTHLQEGKAKSQVVKVEDTLDTPIEKEEKEEP